MSIRPIPATEYYEVLFPNGGILAVLSYIKDTGTGLPIPWDGTVAVAIAPAIHGGVSNYHKVALGTNNAAVIKNSAGQVYGVKAFNNTTYPVFVKLYDKATTPNPAVDVPVKTIGLQAGLGVADEIGFGIPFTNGIGIAIVLGISDTDNNAVVANDCVVDVEYF